MSGRKFRVRVGDRNGPAELSTERPIEAGVVQSSVLGSKTYILYLGDIPPLDPDKNRTEMATYADV